MKVAISLMCLLFMISSCLNNNSDKASNNTSTLSNDSIILNNWILSITKNNPHINSQTINSTGLGNLKDSYFLIPKDTFNVFKTEFARWNYDFSNANSKVFFIDSVLLVDYSRSSDEHIKFYFLRDKFIYSYHAAEGNFGHSVIYDFKKKESTEMGFLDSITNNSAIVLAEKYVFNEENPGHYRQWGKWDMKKDTIIWGKWEN